MTTTRAVHLSHDERILLVRGLLRLRDDEGRTSALIDKLIPGASHELRDQITPPTPELYVYFIAAGPFETNGTPVKIGVSSAPGSRLASLQTSQYKPLTLIAAVPGGRLLEARLHLAFQGDRIRLDGEWFKSSPKLRAAVACLSNNPPVPSSQIAPEFLAASSVVGAGGFEPPFPESDHVERPGSQHSDEGLPE